MVLLSNRFCKPHTYLYPRQCYIHTHAAPHALFSQILHFKQGPAVEAQLAALTALRDENAKLQEELTRASSGAGAGVSAEMIKQQQELRDQLKTAENRNVRVKEV